MKISIIPRIVVIVLCGAFLFQLIYLGKKHIQRRRYFANLPFSEELLEETAEVDSADEDTEEYYIYKTQDFPAVLSHRNPFSDTTYEEEEKRRIEAEQLAFYSILREDYKEETSVNSFAYIIKEKPPLPAPDLDTVEIKGEPNQSLLSPAEESCPFTWKGTLSHKGKEYYFLGNEKKTYSVTTGESIEGYCIKGKKGSFLTLVREGDVYLVKRRR